MATTEQELVEGLKEVKVKEAYIVNRKDKDGKYVNTRTAILTFNKKVIPRRVNVGYYYDVLVEQYYPKPMGCMTCLPLGNKKDNCRGTKKCAKCAEEYHENCNGVERCIECEESHSTLEKNVQYT